MTEQDVNFPINRDVDINIILSYVNSNYGSRLYIEGVSNVFSLLKLVYKKEDEWGGEYRRKTKYTIHNIYHFISFLDCIQISENTVDVNISIIKLNYIKTLVLYLFFLSVLNSNCCYYNLSFAMF